MDLAINKSNFSDSTLIWAIVSSILLHALLALTLPNFRLDLSKQKPIELTIELLQPKKPEPVAIVEPVQPIEPPKPEVTQPKPIKKIQPKEAPKPIDKPIEEPSPIVETEQVVEPAPDIIAVAPKIDSVPIATVPPPVVEIVKPVEVNQQDIDDALGEYGNLLVVRLPNTNRTQKLRKCAANKAMYCLILNWMAVVMYCLPK